MANRKVTINFQRFKTFGPESDKEFKEYIEDSKSKGGIVAYDRRNNIYCVNPTMDIVMYYNYCNYLNECYAEWLHYGYFDMGLVPYLMWPSFMDNSSILEHMRDFPRKVGIDLVKVPTVSFLKPAYQSVGVDYWIRREDLWLLAKSMEDGNPGVYNFEYKGNGDMTLSQFLKGLVNFQERMKTV